ncbi:MAG TPA: 3-hydroxyacyl-CoA dehydrogenase [Microscillaceae bacterium]|jgi:NAD(P)-dependent dehydrogenase (short-subunit alcohol dehydrogenase family)|nr:3-hydroxyacyl-CoA dehydrogenase [Microscillaceae bacterium]
MQLNNTTAVITGGASGLGEACARLFVQQGGQVVIVDMNETRGNQLAEQLGKQAKFVKADVSNETDIKTVVEVALQTFGAIHININCAGIGSATKTVGKEGAHPLDVFQKVIQVNLIGTFNTLRLCAEAMSRNTPNELGEKGVIINTASVAAFDGQIGQAAYSASKGGVVGMTLPIARDLAREGIRVVTIAPGLFATPLFDTLSDEARQALGAQVPFPPRLGNPAEYALLAKSIVENCMLNGETIRLDGAIRMSPR